MNQKLDRAIGALVGSAIGDTFGAPLEFTQARHPNNWVTEITGGGGFGWRPGEVTDDTIMANGITAMYLEHGRYNQTYLVNQWLDWLHRGPKDIGAWTSRALRTMEKSKRPYAGLLDHFHWGTTRWGLRDEKHPCIALWKQNGSRDAGNGGVMRCVPSALATPRSRDRMRETRWICEDTHPDPRCIASCIAVVETCAELIAGGHQSVFGAVSATNTRMQKSSIPWVDNWWTSGNDHMVGQLMHKSLFLSAKLPWEQWTNSGYTIGTLESAFAALHQASSFEEGLIKIVNRGNDADSVGAVAGALLGAKFGFSAIPKRWFDKLEDGPQYFINAQRLYLQIRANR